MLALAWVAWAHSWSVLPTGRRVPGGAPCGVRPSLCSGTRRGGSTSSLVRSGGKWRTLPVGGRAPRRLPGRRLGGRPGDGGTAATRCAGVARCRRRWCSRFCSSPPTRRSNGIIWQTRDGYPLLCGVVLVAGSIGQLHSWRSATARRPRTRASARVRRACRFCVAGSQLPTSTG